MIELPLVCRPTLEVVRLIASCFPGFSMPPSRLGGRVEPRRGEGSVGSRPATHAATSTVASLAVSRMRRRGTTVVEFALVVPIVLMFTFAAVEFARVVLIRHSVDNAVYEAARIGIIPGGSADEVRAAVDRMLAAISVHDYLVEIVPVALAVDSPEITVRVTVPLDTNSYLPAQFFAGKSVRRELTLQREGL